MNHTFEKDVILLMQHPVATTPIDQLSRDEVANALGLIQRLIEWDGAEKCSKSDYLQMARLYFCLAELSDRMDESELTTLWAAQKALKYLSEGGIDLSISRWLRLVNLNYGDDLEIDKPLF